MRSLRWNTESALRAGELRPRVDAARRAILPRPGIDLHFPSGYRDGEPVEPSRSRASVVLTVETVLGAVAGTFEQHRLLAVRHRAAEVHALAVQGHERLVFGDADGLVYGIVAGARVEHEPEAALRDELRF